jgi:hypothetical protein
MKKLTLIFTLVFTVMFSSPSYSEWTKLSTNVDGTTFYVDLEGERKQDGYVYIWELVDFAKPVDDKDILYESGTMSLKGYLQVDCKIISYKFGTVSRNIRRFRTVSVTSYKQPMGRGTGKTVKVDEPWTKSLVSDETWTIRGRVQKKVCSR